MAEAVLRVEQRSYRVDGSGAGSFRRMLRRLRRDPITLACGAILLALVLMAIFAPWIAPADPARTSMAHRLRPPGSPGYPLGADELGRDLLSRLIYGGRLSLLMGFAPVAVATCVGGALGVVAGYAGGFVNGLIMRTMDVFYAFPSILLAVAISGAMGGGVPNALLSLSIVFTPSLARVAESVTRQATAQDYVEAARASGAGAFSIVRAHVLPNVTGPVLVYASSLVGLSIVIGSGLSFLGLGAQPPAAEWGAMLSGLRNSVYSAPINAIIPGLMIFVTTVCLNFLSDGLRSATAYK
jgi:peptide/nickel transport system permease protein